MQGHVIKEAQQLKSKKPGFSNKKWQGKIKREVEERVSSVTHRKRIFESFISVLNKLIHENGFRPSKIDMQSPIAGSLLIITYFGAIKFTWHYYW